jgi:hypothetical protein
MMNSILINEGETIVFSFFLFLEDYEGHVTI